MSEIDAAERRLVRGIWAALGIEASVAAIVVAAGRLAGWW
jgi:hypothetical protein